MLFFNTMYLFVKPNQLLTHLRGNPVTSNLFSTMLNTLTLLLRINNNLKFFTQNMQRHVCFENTWRFQNLRNKWYCALRISAVIWQLRLVYSYEILCRKLLRCLLTWEEGVGLRKFNVSYVNFSPSNSIELLYLNLFKI